MANQSNHKRISRTVIILAVACAAAFAFLLFVEGPNIISKHVTGLNLKQSGFNIQISWNEMECEGYDLTITCDAQQLRIPLQDNHYTLRDATLEKTYRVTVSARLDSGRNTRKAKAKITTQKLKQKVRVSIDHFDGFQNDTVRVKAAGDGDISYSSADKSVASVDSKGNVTLKKSGHTSIIVSAAGDITHQEGRKEIPVNVFPEELSKPVKLSAKNVSDTRTLLTWKPVDYADSYQLLKKNPHTDKYSVIDEVDAKKPEIETTRNDGSYAVRAKATVRGRTVKGKRSDAVKIAGTTKRAKSYSSARNIKVLNKDNLEMFREIHGDGGTTVPQSITLQDDCYVVAYVNAGGTAGKLISYRNTDGECVSIEPCDNMGHANGLTYNPNTNKFYVAKTHKGYRTASCSTYDGTTKESKGSFDLPRVTSGIAYDVSSDEFFLSKGNEIYECDSDFNVKKFIHKFIRYNHAQDIGVYNGVVLVCTWVNGNESYIDLYRVSDSAYLGSYDVSIGEIESCVVDDGYLVILMNTLGNHDDIIYRTKERIAF